MPELKAGDAFPEGVAFTYVPYSPEQPDIIACGIGIKYDASKGKAPAAPLLTAAQICPRTRF